jgi:hypothetical protein
MYARFNVTDGVANPVQHKLQRLPNAVRVRLESEAEPSLEIVAVIQAYQHERIRPVKP